MKTVKENLVCSNCGIAKTRDDFYWHKHLENVKNNPKCKSCLLEELKIKRANKKSELNFAF